MDLADGRLPPLVLDGETAQSLGNRPSSGRTHCLGPVQTSVDPKNSYFWGSSPHILLNRFKLPHISHQIIFFLKLIFKGFYLRFHNYLDMVNSSNL